MNACEVSFVEHMEAWKDSRLGNRPPGYLEYKEQRVERIRERIVSVYPEYRHSLQGDRCRIAAYPAGTI